MSILLWMVEYLLYKFCSKVCFLEILVLIRKFGVLLGFVKKIDFRGCLYYFMESNDY